MRVLLDAEAVSRGLRRVAGEILEHHRAGEHLVLVGIRRGGVPLANALASWLKEFDGHDFPVGSVDITLYRDDAATALPSPRIGPSKVPCSLDGLRVVLVDDVLYTGRTVRAAIDALIDYGRPRRIELAVLIDRGGRELPIRADYVVRTVEVSQDERIDVVADAGGLMAIVQPFTAPSQPPGRP
jgi:pyrimidine operon attenuation protein/uracil phosphoribosyltransferase